MVVITNGPEKQHQHDKNNPRNVTIEWTRTNTTTPSLLDLIQAQVSQDNGEAGAGKELLQPGTIDQLTILVLLKNENDNNTNNTTGCYPTMELATVVPYLTKTATVQVEVVTTTKDSTTAAATVLKQVHTSFVLAGLQSTSEKRLDGGMRMVVTARRISSSSSSATHTAAAAAVAPALLRNQFKAAPITITNSSVDSLVLSNTHSLDNDNDDDDDDNLIDEDALLQSSDVPPPSAMNPTSQVGSGTDDCAGREPCADCTCGRANNNQNNNTAEKTKQVATSSCGKCGLGDAFRCASCPYLGKPAFKAGEEHLVLDLQDDL